jgi:hypothetical protein
VILLSPLASLCPAVFERRAERLMLANPRPC